MATAATCLAYHPTEQDTARFWENELLRESPAVGPPPGFPKELRSSLAWTSEEAEQKRSDWVLKLKTEDVVKLEDALAAFKEHSTNPSDITPETFILPDSLHQRLRGVSNSCYKGLGFQIVSGLDPSKYSVEDNALLYAGIAAHVAAQRGFTDGNIQQRVMAHIVNVSGEAPETKVKAPPGYSKAPVSFHTDNCEIMALYCMDQATEGGQSLLASSWQVYNQLAARRPEVLKTLAETWVLDTFKDYTVWKPRVAPLLQASSKDSVLLRFSRYPVLGWKKERNLDLPEPTQAQLEAIDAVQFFAAANAIRFSLTKGEILFANDMALMHGREAFSENGVFLKRHLLKMYLHDPEQKWPVPPVARAPWEIMYGPNRPDGARDETWEMSYYTGQEDGGSANG